MSSDTRDEGSSFVWRQGRDVITLTRVGEGWQVEYLTVGRLLGPRQCVYQASHRQAKFAAWDVMARVIKACQDEEKGVEAALQAAQWMRRAEAAGGSSHRA